MRYMLTIFSFSTFLFRSITLQDTALANQIAKFPALATRYNSRKLETIGPLPGADHLVMNELPWQEQVLTDGYTGALSWLITQVKEEGGKSGIF